MSGPFTLLYHQKGETVLVDAVEAWCSRFSCGFLRSVYSEFSVHCVRLSSLQSWVAAESLVPSA